MTITNSQERQGVRAREGSQLAVFPSPNRPQSEKATSRDPSSRDPLPLPPSKKVQEGEGAWPEGGRGSRAWEYHEPGTPPEPGSLEFSQIVQEFAYASDD